MLPAARGAGLSSQTQEQKICPLSSHLDKQLPSELGCPEPLGAVLPQGRLPPPWHFFSVLFHLKGLGAHRDDKYPAENSIGCRLWRSVEKSARPVNTCSWSLISWGTMHRWRGRPQTVGSLIIQGWPLAPSVAARACTVPVLLQF